MVLRRTRRFFGRWTGAAMLGLALVACAEVGVKPQDPAEALAAEQRSPLTGAGLSPRTQQALAQRDLLTRDGQEAPEALDALLDELQTGSREAAFVLAELCVEQAQTSATPQAALPLWTTAYACAWAYLLDAGLGEPPSPYDPRFRAACELHNRSLGQLVEHVVALPRPRPTPLTLPLLRGELRILPSELGLPFQPEEFDAFELVWRHAVTGLDTMTRSYGLGVPCVAIRKPRAELDPRDRYLSQFMQSFAVTVLLRAEGGVHDWLEGGTLSARCELHDALSSQTVDVGGRSVPLETDLTTPLAYLLGHEPGKPSPIDLLHESTFEERPPGLVMLRPPERGKVPVVFVHGLMSSPPTWVKLLNGLLADPQLREQTQFWFYRYPTGRPILQSAAGLRSALDEVRSQIDPEGLDPTLDRMVLVGHSMGGLLSKLMVQDSGDAFWDAMFNQPIDQLGLSAADEDFARRLLLFEPRSYVQRAVFLATPHRGSSLATGLVGAVGSALVELPARTLAAFQRLGSTLSPYLRDPEAIPSTGVEGLAPDSPALRVACELPLTVPYHSIIGNDEEAGVPGGTDGVVAYTSSHLDGAESELVLHSGHSVQEHPTAVTELRRILRLHLASE